MMLSECYPYTTLVGASELGYDVERPRYKRKPKRMPMAEWRPLRATACDGLVERLAALHSASPPLDLRSHPTTRRLLEERSPLEDKEYKRREDLIDAVVCTWTAALWWRFGRLRCQVLGLGLTDHSSIRFRCQVQSHPRWRNRRSIVGQ
jgi:predicted RNase H-like nuclease